MLLKHFNFVSENSITLRIIYVESKHVTIMFQSGRNWEKMHQVCIKCVDGERGVYQSPIACQHKRSKKNQVRMFNSLERLKLSVTTRNKEKQKGDCGFNENFETDTVSLKPIGNTFFKYWNLKKELRFKNVKIQIRRPNPQNG